ncbi:MAG: tetratricopeptide repeat protein [Planctomycetota bacterium]
MSRNADGMRTGIERAALAVGIGAVLGLSAGLGGCMGHGRNTSEGLTQAQARMAQIKSATEWEMAEQAFMAGDLDRALEKVNNSIAMNPGVTKSHVLKGRVLLETGELEKARRSLLEAQVIDPTFEEAHYYMGMVNERLARQEEALQSYEFAATLNPEEALYAVAVAEVLIDLNRLDDAQTYLDERAGVFEHNSGVRQTLGHLAMMRGDKQAAADFFRDARLLSPEDSSMLEDLIIAQMEIGEFAEAEYGLSRLLAEEENAGRRDLLRMRARCLIELDRVIEAREALLHLTSADGGDVDLTSWLDLGALAYRTNDQTRLRQAAAKITALAPTRPEGYVYRSIWLRQHGDQQKALEVLEQGFESAEMPIGAVLLRGVLEQDLGMFAAAERSYEAALALDPDDSRASLLLDMLNQPTDGIASFPVPPGE